jgi:hypothetical protein
MTDWMVAGKAVIGTSPIELPDLCIDCGREAQGHRRFKTTLHWFPRWIWVGVLWGILPVVLLYYAARRPLAVEYSLCEEHFRWLRLRKRVALTMWVVFAAVLAACAVNRGTSAFLIAVLATFVLTVVLNMMAWLPLRVAAHEDGVFGVKGFSEEFLERAAPRSPRDRLQ